MLSKNKKLSTYSFIFPEYSRLYRTGDFASIQKGIIYYEGRTDSQIKIRGHRVDLSEVEKNLASLEYIDKGVVLCYHAGEIDQALLGFVTLKRNEENRYIAKTGLQIENDLKHRLASYMIPQVVVLESIPQLVNGKVDRQSLLKMYENTNNNDDAEIELEFDYTNVPENQKDAAKDLFETIGFAIGRSVRSKLTIYSNFYELGGNSLNSIYTVTQLRNKGYFISITDFIGASNLKEILDKICNSQETGSNENSKCDLMIDSDLKLISYTLGDEHKKDTIEIITESFYEKADIEHYIKDEITKNDYSDILEAIWDVLVEKDLSFIVKDSEGRTVGVSLNFDAHDEPEITVTSKLIYVFEFLEYLEGPIR